MFNAKAKKTRNRISNVNQKDVLNRKRRAMLNWEGSLEERCLLAYNALGPGLVSFFNDIQLPFNEQVTDTAFPVIGNSLSTDTLAYLFNQDSPGYTSLMTKASAIPANLPDEASVITAITDAFAIPPEYVLVKGENICGSSAESVKVFWLWQIPKVMHQCQLRNSGRSESVGFS